MSAEEKAKMLKPQKSDKSLSRQSSETNVHYVVSMTSLPDRDSHAVFHHRNDQSEYEHVLYQNEYSKQFMFSSIAAPSWKYMKPPPQLLVRGLTADTMHTIVCDMNQLSIQTCKATDKAIIRLIPIFLSFLFINGVILILLAIYNEIEPKNIFIIVGCIQCLLGLFFGFFSICIASKNRKKCILKSLEAVQEYVENELNDQFEDNFIEFDFVEYRLRSATVQSTSLDMDDDDDDEQRNVEIKSFGLYNICISMKLELVDHVTARKLSKKLLSVEE